MTTERLHEFSQEFAGMIYQRDGIRLEVRHLTEFAELVQENLAASLQEALRIAAANRVAERAAAAARKAARQGQGKATP